MKNRLPTTTKQSDLGPAMRALNPRQQAFVIAVLELGSTNYTRAAALAGYGLDSDNGLRVIAHRLAHDEKVLRALNEEAHRRLMASAPMAISELVKIAESEQEKKYKIKAIELILNRTGHHALTEHKVEVQHTYSDQQTIARIYTLAKQMNMDPVKLLGAAGVKADDKGEILDAEFTEVPEGVVELREPEQFQTNEFDWKGDDNVSETKVAEPDLDTDTDV